MFKKLSKILLVLGLTTFLVVPVYAQNHTDTITKDTLITDNNLHQVLEHLEIDPNLVERSNSRTTSTCTVGELEDIFTLASSLPKNIHIEEDIILSELEDFSNTQAIQRAL